MWFKCCDLGLVLVWVPTICGLGFGGFRGLVLWVWVLAVAWVFAGFVNLVWVVLLDCGCLFSGVVLLCQLRFGGFMWVCLLPWALGLFGFGFWWCCLILVFGHRISVL